MELSLEKRFEYFTREGKAWTSWFPCNEKPEKWQVPNKLRNQYRIRK